jgi:mycothiol system anti-sigma-R factor
MTDCNETLKELEQFLDSELATGKLENLTAHLDGCVDCQQTFEFHAELRQIVRQAVHHESLPECLVDRIKECFGTDLTDESETR